MNQPILVTSYVNPDLDGLACCLAYAELLNQTGRPALAGIFSKPQIEACFVLDYFSYPYPSEITDPTIYSKIVLTDTTMQSHLHPKFEPEKVIEIIDHHPFNEGGHYPNAKIQQEEVGAAATLVAERFKLAKVKMSQMSARLLALAIVSNSLNFKSQATKERDHLMYQWLLPQAQLPPGLVHKMFLAKSDLSGQKLSAAIDDDASPATLAGRAVSALQLEIIESEKLVAERLPEILTEIERQKNLLPADIIFLSILDLEKDFNLFITPDATSQKILSEVLGLQFQNNVAKYQGLILRKEVKPLLKKYLEKHV